MRTSTAVLLALLCAGCTPSYMYRWYPRVSRPTPLPVYAHERPVAVRFVEDTAAVPPAVALLPLDADGPTYAVALATLQQRARGAGIDAVIEVRMTAFDRWTECCGNQTVVYLAGMGVGYLDHLDHMAGVMRRRRTYAVTDTAAPRLIYDAPFDGYGLELPPDSAADSFAYQRNVQWYAPDFLLIDPRGWKFATDAHSRLISRVHGTQRFRATPGVDLSYDTSGRLAALELFWDGRKQRAYVQLVYDATGRLLEKRIADAPSQPPRRVEYAYYDERGRLEVTKLYQRENGAQRLLYQTEYDYYQPGELPEDRVAGTP